MLSADIGRLKLQVLTSPFTSTAESNAAFANGEKQFFFSAEPLRVNVAIEQNVCQSSSIVPVHVHIWFDTVTGQHLLTILSVINLPDPSAAYVLLLNKKL